MSVVVVIFPYVNGSRFLKTRFCGVVDHDYVGHDVSDCFAVFGIDCFVDNPVDERGAELHIELVAVLLVHLLLCRQGEGCGAGGIDGGCIE